MEPDASARSAGRSRTWLLIALAVVAGLYLVMTVWPGKSAEAPPALSNQPRGTTGKAQADALPAELEVRLEALKQPKPVAAETGERNPFKFYVKPPPPPPPPPTVSRGTTVAPPPPVDTGPPPPPPPPPIPLKFFGIVEPKPGDKVATFSDCRTTTYGREGDIVAGQYRLVKMGVESVIMEYLDGRGRQTIRLSGQDCIGK